MKEILIFLLCLTVAFIIPATVLESSSWIDAKSVTISFAPVEIEIMAAEPIILIDREI